MDSLIQRLDRLERKVPGWTLAAICAVMGLLVVGCGAGATLTASRELNPAALGRVAVMPFGGYRSDVFADLVTHELLAVGVAVVERSRLAEVLAEQNLRLDDLAAGKGDVQRIGRALGAEVLVFGSASSITVYTHGHSGPAPRPGGLAPGPVAGTVLDRCRVSRCLAGNRLERFHPRYPAYPPGLQV